MKPIQLLPFYLAAVSARDLASSPLNIGICRSPSWSALDVCGPEAAMAQEDAGLAPSSSSSSSSWTHSSPCYSHDNGTAEFCVFSSAAFAGGRGISVLTTAERAALVARKPAFTEPEVLRGVNRDLIQELIEEQNDDDSSSSSSSSSSSGEWRTPKNYKVVEMPGKGMGVVAARFLQRGDHIMSNTASVMVDYAAFEAVPEAQIRRLQAAAVDRLPAYHRARFLNLSTHSGAGGYEERVDKILATNAFDIEPDEEIEDSFFVVFPEISRMNHDCRPNADYHFDPDTLTQHIHAVRPIAAGEEITVSYMDPVQSRKKRQAKLHGTWGFRCTCPLCSQPAATMGRASDARIAQIRALRRELQDYSSSSSSSSPPSLSPSRATPQMAELLVSLYQQERLDGLLYEAYALAALEWNGAGEPWTATKYARLAVEYGLASVGPRDEDVREMRRLAEDPWAHWSWMLRTSRRMGWGRRAGGGRRKEGEEKGEGGEEGKEE